VVANDEGESRNQKKKGREERGYKKRFTTQGLENEKDKNKTKGKNQAMNYKRREKTPGGDRSFARERLWVTQ